MNHPLIHLGSPALTDTTVGETDIQCDRTRVGGTVRSAHMC